jgi:hypothetical protein
MENINELETLLSHIEEIDVGSVPYDIFDHDYACKRHLIFMIGLYFLIDALLEAHGSILVKDIIQYFERYGVKRREVMDVLLWYSMENYAKMTGLAYDDLKGSLNDGTLTREDVLRFFRKDNSMSAEDEKLL